MSAPVLTFTDIVDKVERAVRNGQRAHLDQQEAVALMGHPAWAMLAAERTKEILASCGVQHLRTASNSGHIGSITGPNETTGASAGTIPKVVHDAGEALALEAAKALTRQKRRARH